MTIVVVCEVLQREARHATGLNVPRKVRHWGVDCHGNWSELSHHPVGSMGTKGGRNGMKKEDKEGEGKRKTKDLLNLADSPDTRACFMAHCRLLTPQMTSQFNETV